MQNLTRAVLGLPLLTHRPAPPAASAVEPTLRDALVGVYDLALPNGGTLVLHVTTEGDGLAAQGEGQARIPLVHLGNDVFGAGFDPSLRLSFDRAPGGRVTGATVQQGGATPKGPRRP